MNNMYWLQYSLLLYDNNVVLSLQRCVVANIKEQGAFL